MADLAHLEFGYIGIEARPEGEGRGFFLLGRYVKERVSLWMDGIPDLVPTLPLQGGSGRHFFLHLAILVRVELSQVKSASTIRPGFF